MRRKERWQAEKMSTAPGQKQNLEKWFAEEKLNCVRDDPLALLHTFLLVPSDTL